MDDQNDNVLLRAYIDLRPALRAFIKRRLAVVADAEDLLQDLGTRIVGTELDHQIRNPHAYLFSAASNLVRDHHRRHYVQNIASHVSVEELEIADQAASQFNQTDARQRWSRLQKGLSKLPKDGREAFVLHRVNGMTLTQVAQEMGVSVSRVRKLVDRSLSRLSAYVWDED